MVDEAEPGGFATSEVGLKAKGEDPVSGAVVHLGQLLTDLRMKISNKFRIASRGSDN